MKRVIAQLLKTLVIRFSYFPVSLRLFKKIAIVLGLFLFFRKFNAMLTFFFIRITNHTEQCWHLLHRAVLDRNRRLVKFLLWIGIHPDERGFERWGRRPLDYASDAKIVDILIEAGADLDNGQTLMFAAVNQRWDIVVKLLESGINPNQRFRSEPGRHNALTEAVHRRNTDMIIALMVAGTRLSKSIETILQSQSRNRQRLISIAAITSQLECRRAIALFDTTGIVAERLLTFPNVPLERYVGSRDKLQEATDKQTVWVIQSKQLFLISEHIVEEIVKKSKIQALNTKGLIANEIEHAIAQVDFTLIDARASLSVEESRIILQTKVWRGVMTRMIIPIGLSTLIPKIFHGKRGSTWSSVLIPKIFSRSQNNRVELSNDIWGHIIKFLISHNHTKSRTEEVRQQLSEPNTRKLLTLGFSAKYLSQTEPTLPEVDHDKSDEKTPRAERSKTTLAAA